MQVAIITGAGSGIGLATARMLHDTGMAVVGIGRDPAKLKALEETIGHPERLVALAVDITAKDAPKLIVDQALERFGRIDFLVNNAGIGSPKPLHETDDDTLDHFLDIMLRAPFRLARDVIPHMQAGSGEGRIEVAHRAHGLRIWPIGHPLELRGARRHHDRHGAPSLRG